MDSARRACRDHSSLYPVPRRPGPLVDPASARIWDQMGRDSWSILCQIGTGTESARIAGRARVSSNPGRGGRDSWSTPRQLGPGTKWFRTAGRPCVNSDPGTSRPGQLVHPTAPRTRVRVGRDIWSTPQLLGLRPCCPGQLSDLASALSWDHMGRGRWSTLCKVGSGTESARIAGEHHSSSDAGSNRP